MADLGLLTGLAEGLKGGLEGYRTERAYQDQKKKEEEDKVRQKLLTSLALSEKGYEEGPGGILSKTSAEREKEGIEQASKQAGLLKTGYKAELNPETGKYEAKSIPGYRDEERENLRLKNKTLAAELAQIGKPKTADLAKSAVELRKELLGLPTSRDTQSVVAAHSKINKALDAKSPGGDMAAIYSYMRILDPTSSVKEGEYASAKNAASVPEQVRNAYNNAMAGTLLSDKQREDFRARADEIKDAQLEVQERLGGQYSTLAKRSGVAPEDVVLSFGERGKGLVNPALTKKQGGGLIPEAQASTLPPPNMSFEQFKAWRRGNQK